MDEASAESIRGTPLVPCDARISIFHAIAVPGSAGRAGASRNGAEAWRWILSVFLTKMGRRITVGDIGRNHFLVSS